MIRATNLLHSSSPRIHGSPPLRWILSFTIFLLAPLCSLGPSWGEPVAPGARVARLAHGGKLFMRKWTADDDLARGDGLGPLHNDVSCVACHFQGATGGAGPREKNVLVLTVLPPKTSTKARQRKFLQDLRAFHPGFVSMGKDSVARSLILHRQGSDPAYDDFVAALTGKPMLSALTPEQQERVLRAEARKQKKAGPGPTVTRLPDFHGLSFIITERNTPALFGNGAIDRIPVATLLQIANDQKARDDGITGRFVGKFGWRGQISTLHEFVSGACANELGLTTSESQQAVSPIDRRPEAAIDLTPEDVEAMTLFVASLREPRPVEEPSAANDIRRGKRFFETLQCSRCHIQDVHPARNIYSDLLLHDMGPELTDPLPASPELVSISRSAGPPVRRTSGYLGGAVDVMSVMTRTIQVPTNTDREWRTPPLWGVADSAPYLHDGRAATIDQAIRYHGGEASKSRSLYLALGTSEKGALLTFLKTLRAVRPHAVNPPLGAP